MTTDELIQLIRTCNLAQVRKQLEKWEKRNPESFETVRFFYKQASAQKP